MRDGYPDSRGPLPSGDRSGGVARRIYPNVSEVIGLLALLMFHDARRDARLDEHGEPVPLPDQNRERWDRGAIQNAITQLDQAVALGAPGPFATEAAIAAVHCRARTEVETDLGESRSRWGSSAWACASVW